MLGDFLMCQYDNQRVHGHRYGEKDVEIMLLRKTSYDSGPFVSCWKLMQLCCHVKHVDQVQKKIEIGRKKEGGDLRAVVHAYYAP